MMKTDERTLPSHNRTGLSAFLSARADKLLSFGALFVCCAVLTALRCRQLSTEQGGSACVVITVCSAAVMILLSLRARNNFRPALRYGMLSVTFGASVSAGLLLVAIGISVYYARFAAHPVSDVNAVVSFLVKLFALLSAVAFLATSALESISKRVTLHLLLTLPPIFFCSLRVLNTFINSSTLPLAESGGYRVLGMIAAMLFFLNEGKLLLGVKSTLAYQITGFSAAIFCAAYDLPLLIAGVRDGGYRPEAAYSLLTVGLVAYILTRIATLPAKEE